MDDARYRDKCVGQAITPPGQAADRLREAHGLFTAPERFMRLARDPEARVRRAVAVNKMVPKAAFDLLVADPDLAVRVAAATNCRAGTDHLHVLAVDSETAVRIAIAGARDLPEEIRGHLAVDRSWRVREAVAADRRTPEALLLQLARDPRDEVRTAAYANPSSSPAVRAAVEERPTVRIRERDAGSLLTSPEQLTRLACDRAAPVRAEVARNDATPPEVVRRLLGDRANEVRALAAIRGVEGGFVAVEEAAPILLLSQVSAVLLVEALETSSSRALIELALAVGDQAYLVASASASFASVEQLNRLLATGDPATRRAVVNHPATTATMLDDLARLPGEFCPPPMIGLDPPGVIRRRYCRFSYALAVAQHPNASDDTLQWLLTEGSPTVREALARRPVLWALLSLSTDHDDEVRKAVAAQPLTPTVILADLASDDSWQVRAAVHANPSANAEVRKAAERMGITAP